MGYKKHLLKYKQQVIEVEASWIDTDRYLVHFDSKGKIVYTNVLIPAFCMCM